MRWVLLDEVLRHSDVLNHRLRVASCLNRVSDQLRAHEFILESLLVLGQSNKQKLDVLLHAHEEDGKGDERNDEEGVDAIAGAFLSLGFVDSRHPVDELLNVHVIVGWAPSSLKLKWSWLSDRFRLLKSVIVVENLIFTVHVVHSVVMRLQLSCVSVVVNIVSMVLNGVYNRFDLRLSIAFN